MLESIADGLTIDGVNYGAVEARVDRAQGDNTWLTLGIREGKNREVKRILEHLGLQVSRLIRISFGPFQLGEMDEGAVEEVRTRVLKDQLGIDLAREAQVDFDLPLREGDETERQPLRQSHNKSANNNRDSRFSCDFGSREPRAREAGDRDGGRGGFERPSRDRPNRDASSRDRPSEGRTQERRTPEGRSARDYSDRPRFNKDEGSRERGASRERPSFDRSDRNRDDRSRPAFGASSPKDRQDKNDSRPPRPDRFANKTSIWRQGETQNDEASQRRKPFRGDDPKAARNSSADRPHRRSGNIEDPQGRAIKVERVIPERDNKLQVRPREGEYEARAPRPRSFDGERRYDRPREERPRTERSDTDRPRFDKFREDRGGERSYGTRAPREDRPRQERFSSERPAQERPESRSPSERPDQGSRRSENRGSRDDSDPPRRPERPYRRDRD